MGCGGSSEASGKAYGVDTVGILGVQGAGKSTVMKQFRNDGNFELAPAQARAIKDDILKAVALRTRVLLEYLVDVGDPDDEAKNGSNR